jgi:molybdopterin converting factor small subunit
LQIKKSVNDYIIKSMKLELLAFGIAKDIIRGSSTMIEVQDATTVGQLKALLFDQYPAFAKLRSLSIAVNTEYRADDYTLSPDDEIVLIPPVSGG